MTRRDPRVTPARPDLAAASLRGKVSATAYAEGSPYHATATTAIRFRPVADARQESQLLPGEAFTVYEIGDDWAWGQAALDDYVGYITVADLAAGAPSPTHRVDVPASHLYPGPDLKLPVLGRIGFGARLTVDGAENGFRRTPLGWVFARHLAPLTQARPDYVDTALRFLGVPYLWGGRSADGLDCSGLVQLALQAAGLPAPRDSDQQAAQVGQPVANLDQARAGDLVAFPGHIGILMPERRFLHANAFYMQVTVDPLDEVLPRAGAITAIRRLG